MSKNIGVGLHNHSEGSFLDGYASVNDIAKRAAEIGMSAIAVTDHGECNMHLAHQRACDKVGIKPIFGMEGYLVDSIARVRTEKDRKNSHLGLIAETNKGLENLWTISSKAYIEGMYFKPLIDWESVKPYTEGIIATDGCLLAYMARAILEENDDRVEELLGRYVDTFGEENFFMELHTFQLTDPVTDADKKLNADMTKMNQGKVKIAEKYGLPLIVVNDSHFAEEMDWENHSLLWAMSTYDKNGDKTSAKGKSAAWIMSDEENYFWMEKHGIQRSVIEKAIANTAEIADRCSARIISRLHLPSLTGSRAGDKKLFLDQIEAGFQKKVVEGGLDQSIYRPRLVEECHLIVDSKEFDGYFNIVADYVSYAKNVLEILVGAGRGSGGGSLVCWLMGITAIDPIKYGLLFSRFLNEARTDMPDIDVDFPQSRVKEIKEIYLPNRYGKDNVCAIGNLARGKTKGIFKDVARAMGISYGISNELSTIFDKAYLPQGVDGPEEWAIIKKQMEKELAPYKAAYPLLFQKAEEMIGLVRQSGTHAAGMIISDTSLFGQMPMRIKGDSKMPISQFENSETKFGHPDVTEMGYIKYDTLSLRTLDTLQAVYDIVKERHGIEAVNGAENSTEFYENFGDKEYTYGPGWDAVAAGDTLGIFQIETGNALPSVKRMKPRNEVDMADLTSVIRPGVVKAGLLDVYFNRKDGIEHYRSIHPMLDDILDRTYGIVVYQEQALKVFLQIGGYTPAEAEKMRKMIGKKLVDKMNAEKPRFIERCLTNKEFMAQMSYGSDPKVVVNQMWNNIEATGSYAFNEAHAIGYSLTACQGVYMKAMYPAEYFTALLRTDPENKAAYVRAIRKRKIAILPPDINDSKDLFTITDDGIRYGITAVYGVADFAYREIRDHAPYSSFEDFMERTSKRACNKRVMVNLISIGAFDRFGDRTTIMQKFLLARKIKDVVVPNFYDETVVQELEMALVGSYIQVDPMEKYRGIIEGECLVEPEQMDGLLPNEQALIGGQIIEVKHHNTKTKGEPMCFMKVLWDDGIFDLTVFPREFKRYKLFIREGSPVICEIEKLERGQCVKELVRLDKI